MNVSHEWLKELIPVQMTPAEMSDVLSSRCAPVDEIIRLRADLAHVVVARVVKAGPHPNSDHLWVTKVDNGGGELLDVVCGAPNVKEGALYPFAGVGTTLPGGFKLEKKKIRGELSNGMLLSAREMGLGDDHSGILELDVDVPPGTPLLEAVPLGDSRIVVDVTPNRPDLLSHVGLARELCAAANVSMRTPGGMLPGWRHPVRSAATGSVAGVTVRLDDVHGCPRYVGAIIKGVTVAPSPDWLRLRLEAIGQRPLNNIVDVTNYLLHECGQPMHAFDLDCLDGSAVVIRKARDGEQLITLDGVERTLNSSMTVIADIHTAQAVAGVMGGLESAVSDATRNVFLEIANFDPAQIRATRLALGFSTDASYRFERGVDCELPGEMVGRAVEMLVKVAGGELADTALDLYPAPRERTIVSLRSDRASRVLGENLSSEEIVRLLQSVGFLVSTAGAVSRVLEVTVPSWRVDVCAEIDLVEELARLRGYESFSDEIRPYRPGTVPGDKNHRLASKLRELLAGFGLFEARPLPFVRGDDASHVRVANPISEDERHLRRSILETLSPRLEYNLSHMNRNVRLFEIGNVFKPSGKDMPSEEMHVGAALHGDRTPAHFTEPKPPPYDVWDAKALAQSLARTIYPDAAIGLIPQQGSEDGLRWTITADSADVGTVRELVLDAPVWAAPAFGVEVRIGEVSSAAVAPQGENAYRTIAARGSVTVPSPTVRGAGQVRFSPLPLQPAADFDLALVVPETLMAEQVETVLRRAAGELLESLELFDEFHGKGLPDGTRSLAWRLTFRHPERTLRDKEVEGRRQKLLTVLEKELGVRQRST